MRNRTFVGIGTGVIVVAGLVFFSAVKPHQADGSLWSSVGPGGGGWLTDVAFHPASQSTILTTLDCGGVRVSRNLGKSWELPTKGFRSHYGSEVEGVFVHPKKTNEVFLAAWTGIYRSTDAGKSWGEVLHIGDGVLLRVNTIAFDPDNQNVLYAGSGTTRQSLGFVNTEGFTGAPGTLWRSLDRGKTWKRLFQFDRNLSIYSMIVDGKKTVKESDNTLLFFTNKGLYRSSNGGKSFGSFGKGLPENLRQAVQSVRDRKKLWTAVMYDGVYESSNWGANWKRIGPTEKHAYVYLEADTNKDGRHRDTLLVSAQDWFGVGGVWEGTRNTQGGYAWKSIFPSKTIQEAWNPHDSFSSGAVAVGYPRGKRTILLVGPGARLLSSSDNGSSWNYLHSTRVGGGLWSGNNFELMILGDGAIDPRNGAIYLSYIDMGTFVSRDGGYSWKQLNAGGHFAGGNPEAVAVNPLTGEVFVSVESGKVLASLDGGENFRETLNKLVHQISFGSDGTSYAATDDGVMLRSGQGAWSAVGDLKKVVTLAVSHATLYAGNSEGVWKLEAGKWNKVANVQGLKAGGLVARPASGTFLLMTDEGILLQGDKGQLRVAMAGNFEALKGVGTTVYAKSRDSGIWRSVDFGATWKNVTDGVYQDGYERGLVIDPRNPNTVFYGSKCMGVFKRDFSTAP